MSDQQTQYLKFITPRGVTSYPRFNKPDTGPKNKQHDPQFKTKLAFTNDASFIVGKSEVSGDDMVAKLEAMRDALFEETKAELKKAKKGEALKKLTKRPVFAVAVDDDGEDTDGLTLNCKMYALSKDKKTGEIRKRTLPIFNAKGAPLKVPPQIGGGSEVKLALSAKAYYNATNGEVGVTYYLDSVQLLKLVEFQGRTAEGFGFGKEEGYDGEGAATEFGDESASTESEAAADDEEF